GYVAVQHEHVSLESVQLRVRSADRVTRAARLFLHGDAQAGECVACVRRRDDDERVGTGALGGVDHPVDEAAPEQRVQVLRHGRPHPCSEPGGHYDSCWLRVAQRRVNGWGARIRTWDRGTKTRCLTTWLRPTVAEYRNHNDRHRKDAAALGCAPSAGPITP